eukprot:4546991-Pyramimonas_sp.AAC.1
MSGMMRLPHLVTWLLLGLVSVVSGLGSPRLDVPIILHADLVSKAMDVLEHEVRAKGYTNVTRLESCFQTTAICRNGPTAECVRARECHDTTLYEIESAPLVPGSLFILELDPGALVRAAGKKNTQWDADPGYLYTEQRLEALLARDTLRRAPREAEVRGDVLSHGPEGVQTWNGVISVFVVRVFRTRVGERGHPAVAGEFE